MSVFLAIHGGESWVGRPLPRREDERLTAGAGVFVDDMKFPGMLHVALVRSPHAHARIVRVDVAAARRLPGVYAVLTGSDVVKISKPLRSLIPIPVDVQAYCLAIEKVRFVGDPVVAIAAVDRATAEDAVDLVEVEYQPLAPAVDPLAAMEPGAPLVFDELASNVVWHDSFEYGDPKEGFRRAAHTFTDRISVHRYVSTPLETMGVIARWENDGVTIWCNDQRPGFATQAIASALQLGQSRIRLMAPDIGGGFGNKRKATYLTIAALLAKITHRPVKYVEDRQESLMGLVHASNQTMDLSLALDREGHILAMSVRDVADEGANILNPTLHSVLKLTNMLNCYRIPALQFEGFSVLTNKCPSGPNRGIGKPFMCFAVERAVNLAARRLGMDPIEIRRRNFIPAEDMPYDNVIGNTYDSGDYNATLDKALEVADYPKLLREQEEARRQGRYVGIGIASAVEPNTLNLSAYELMTGRNDTSGVGEGALVRMEADATVRVALGNVPSGQGYETVVGQIVADELGVTPDDVNVTTWFDSSYNPWLYCSGSFANKFSGTDVGAIVGAARTVRQKILRLAAPLCGHAVEELTLRDKGVWLIGGNEPLLALTKIANTAYRDLLRLPPGEMPGLEARHYYVEPQANLLAEGRKLRFQLTYSNSAHVVMTEVNPDTGAVKILRYAICHDCGREMNPLLVEGMVHGATAHGIGGTLFEELIYDENGQFLTGSFMDYLKPTALDVPEFEVGALETPSPFTALGAKGVGEGGSIPSLAAITNSVEDALKPFGVTLNSLPLTPGRLWATIQKARMEQGSDPHAN
jgi:2-furoyl-CoA dehydrogenase large subunit